MNPILYQSALLFVTFFIYAVLGWICEVIYCSVPQKRFINRGFLNGPYCPIYGVGAVIVIGILTPWSHNPIAVFFIGLIVTSVLEYFTSWAMEKLFHAKWWDYSNYKFNINGRVCLKNSLLFALLCLVLMYGVHPFVKDLIGNLSPFTLEVTAGILGILLLTDIVSSTLETIHLTQKLKQVSEIVTTIAEELYEKGIESREYLAHRIALSRHSYEEQLETARNDLNLFLEDFSKKLSEHAALRRYSHKRLLKAFPNMVTKHDPASVKIYRESIRTRDYLHRLNKKIKKQQRR